MVGVVWSIGEANATGIRTLACKYFMDHILTTILKNSPRSDDTTRAEAGTNGNVSLGPRGTYACLSSVKGLEHGDVTVQMTGRDRSVKHINQQTKTSKIIAILQDSHGLHELTIRCGGSSL